MFVNIHHLGVFLYTPLAPENPGKVGSWLLHGLSRHLPIPGTQADVHGSAYSSEGAQAALCGCWRANEMPVQSKAQSLSSGTSFLLYIQNEHVLFLCHSLL